MALPPSIPTSFVPHPASSVTSRSSGVSFSGIFAAIAYLILALVVAAAIGLFFYERVLVTELHTQDLALTEAESKINQTGAESFIELRNRLSSSVSLLKGHIALSGFFTALEKVMPSTIRFGGLHFIFDDKGVVKIQGGGVAKTFNSLAVASIAFAQDTRIKNVIFSNIGIDKKSGVSFTISATLDPSLTVFSPSASTDTGGVPPVVASSTPLQP